MSEFGSIFVSYARVDTKKVTELIGKPRDDGFDLWIDAEGIEGAAFWRKEIVEAIQRCSAVLFFASEASCQSETVSKELALASDERKFCRSLLKMYSYLRKFDIRLLDYNTSRYPATEVAPTRR